LKADEATNGQIGLKCIDKKASSCCRKAYKLVFVDFNMPVMGGIDFMKNIKYRLSTNSIQK